MLVAVDKDGYAQLLGLGMRTQIDLVETAKLTPAAPPPGQESGIPGYPCYRTVEETFATGDSIIAAHPKWPATSTRATHGKKRQPAACPATT